MNILTLQQTRRPFFTIQNVAQILGISPDSAKVLCSRYVKSGLLLRLRNNLYILSSQVETMGIQELFHLSNLIQTPSCISLTTALSYYQITTQITRDVVEAISPIRSVDFESGPLLFNYTKFKKELYFGYIKKENFFIAEKEKAFLDAVYLMSLGRYALDLSSLDLNRLSFKKLKIYSKAFPEKTQKVLNRLLIES